MGGEGSGRKPNPENMFKRTSPYPAFTDTGLTFPPTAHIKEEALRRDPTDITGSALEVQSAGTTVDATVDTLDFSDEFTLAESPEDDIDISLNLSNIDHDSLQNFVANEHIDWTADQGATNIHANNYTDTDTTDHTALSNIGTNTHAQIDTHIADTTDAHTVSSDTLTFTNKTIDADGTGNSITNIDNANIKAGAAIDISKTALVAGTNITLSTNTLNVDDAFLKNDEADTGVGLTLTGDNSSADTQYTAQVLYNTDETPPTASGFPVGTIYIQYTA